MRHAQHGDRPPVTDELAPEAVIALAEETLEVEKRVVETGRVNVQTFVEHEDVVLRETLLRDNVDVERVAVGRAVDIAPLVRDDGDYFVVPVVEERLIVTKQLFLVEELRIRRSTVAVPVELPATRRIMRAVVERDEIVASTPEETRI